MKQLNSNPKSLIVENEHRLHKIRLQTIRSRLSNLNPRPQTHLQSKGRQKLLDNLKLTEHMMQNHCLLTKMLSIDNRKNISMDLERPSTQAHKILIVSPRRKQQMRRIADENLVILKSE